MKYVNTKKGHQTQSSSRGFTLVESLVAIMIILAAITGAFAVAQGGLSASNLAKERVEAYFLAQETVEMIKNARDHNNLARYISGDGTPSWLQGIAGAGDPCEWPQACDWRLDLGEVTGTGFLLGEFVPCTSNGWCVLKSDDFGILSHDGTNDTGFTRKATIREYSSPNNREAEVEVTVGWRNNSHTVVIKENIYNWSVAE